MKKLLLLLAVLSVSAEMVAQNKSASVKKEKMNTYQAPAQTKVGHIHLKVSNIDRALGFYRDILGFQVMQYYGKDAVFLSAGGYHHHIGLNTWASKGAGRADERGVGLYHAAFLYPTRKDLAVIVKRLIDLKYPLIGASDHGVSEAVYLEDPDGNGIELYWDKPKNQWPFDKEGNLQMTTLPLNLQNLLKEIK